MRATFTAGLAAIVAALQAHAARDACSSARTEAWLCAGPKGSFELAHGPKAGTAAIAAFGFLGKRIRN